MASHGATPHSPCRATRIWLVLSLGLLAPSIGVWLLRGTAFAFHCVPGPQPCSALPAWMPLGQSLRGALDLAWALALNDNLLLAGGIAAAVAALCARRPVAAFVSAVSLAPASLLLPVLAVSSATYAGCAANEGGVGDCRLWGTSMGMSFHNAAVAPWVLYTLAPYCAAAAVMLGLVGLIFVRRRTAQ